MEIWYSTSGLNTGVRFMNKSHKKVSVRKKNWHYSEENPIERFLCNLFNHKVVKPSPTSEIEQCMLCYKWRYL